MPLFPGDATTTLPGLITLAGDLGGTYALPTVVGIQGIAVPAPSGTNTALTYNSGAYTWAAGGGSGITQLTGDVTAGPGSGSVASTVISITGASGTVLIASTGNIITWNKATTAPGLAQTILTTDATPANMTIAAQSAELAAATNLTGGSLILQSGSGATTSGIAGDVVVNIPTSTLSTKSGHLKINVGGTNTVSIGGMTSDVTTDTGIWMNPGGVASNSSVTVTIDSFSQGTYFCDGGRGIVALSNADVGTFALNNLGAINTATLSSGYNLGIQGMTVSNYGGTVGAIGLATVTTAPTGNVTGSVLYTASDGYLRVITTGTSTPQLLVGAGGVDVMTGYNLFVNSANATTSSTLVGGLIMAKASTNPSNSITNAQMYADSSTGNISFWAPSSTAYSMNVGSTNINLNGVNLLWTNTSPTPELLQTALASTSAGSGSNGQTMSIIAQAGQAATGASNNGGNGANLILSSGALGTSGSATAGVAGLVEIQAGGTTLFQYGVAGHAITSATQAMVNGTNTLSAAKYQSGLIILTGTVTAACTLVFPNVIGLWYVDVSGLSGISGTNTLGFTSGSKTVTAVTTIATTDTLWIVSTRGSNTMSINT